MTSGNPIRATGASEAHLGVSLRDCGAAVPRSAYGGAAFSSLEERNDAIRKASQTGLTNREIAEQFGLTRGRVSQILLKRPRPPVRARAKMAETSARTDVLLREYEAGFGLGEIGERHGLCRTRVCKLLTSRDDYVPRLGRRVSEEALDAILVPTWVPERHRRRYRQITAANDEPTAAGCIRRMKVLEARA